MRTGLVAGAIAAAAVVAGGAWYGASHFGKPAPRATTTSPPIPDAPETGNDVVTVDSDAARTIDAGATPMAQRVAVLGLLNKRNGVSRDLTMRPGQARRVGDTVIRLRACEHTAPWEQQTLTGALVQLDVQGVGVDRNWRRVFSGWLYKERPELNVVLHPVYDVWVKSCTMSFPQTGPDTVSAGAPSSAKKSAPEARPTGGNADEPKAAPAAPSAVDSNAT